jgi:hypothetical protein
MKRDLFRLIFGGVLFLGIAAGSVSAADFAAYPNAIGQGDIVINAGVGFGTPVYGNMTIPPISVSVDYALPIGGLPFMVGGLAGFNRSKWSGVGYTYTYTGIALAGRFGYHPDLGVKNLNAYTNMSLGYYIYNGKSSNEYSPASYSRFYWALNLGARYFFTSAIGAFVELGYSELSFVSAGVAIKF